MPNELLPTQADRDAELEECFRQGDCAWTVREAVRSYVSRHRLSTEAAIVAELYRLADANETDDGSAALFEAADAITQEKHRG